MSRTAPTLVAALFAALTLPVHANSNRGTRSEIVAGQNNTIDRGAANSTIAGGNRNRINRNGKQAIVAGGQNNLAGGTAAFAAGNKAQARHSGTFVWGDGQSPIFGSTAANQFLIRAQRGVGINTNNPRGNALSVRGNTLLTGNLQVTGSLLSGSGNTSSGAFSAVGGGQQNTASGENAAIGGGSNNVASGTLSTVGGGVNNAAISQGATVSGGQGNAAGLRSTVGGGMNNTNYGDLAFIGGGQGNTVAIGTSGAAIVGGADNTNSGSFATIGGGLRNVAGAQFATVPGGNLCLATHTGSFVWSGEPFETTSSWGDYTFTVRAHGGARFYTAPGTVTYASLAAGDGAWTAMSDRNAKENFGDVNTSEVLAKVAAMPIKTWNYKTQADSIRHIGPTAQDFKSAFGVGESDTGITTVDADGVALAAIQGLVEELKERDKAIRELRNELRTLRDQVQNSLPPAP